MLRLLFRLLYRFIFFHSNNIDFAVDLVRELHLIVADEYDIKLIGEQVNISLEAVISRAFTRRYYDNTLKSNLELICYLAEAIIVGHPFLDGNKRTALALLNTLEPRFNDIDIDDIIIRIAEKNADYKDLVRML